MVMSFSSFWKENSPSVAFPIKSHVPKTAWDFPNLHVGEDLAVQQGDPGAKPLDLTLKFIHQTTAMVGQVKQQIPSKEGSPICGAIMPPMKDLQVHADPEVLLDTAVCFMLN